MSFDLSWFKYTGLSAAQHAAAVALPLMGGDAFNILHFDYVTIGGISLGAAVTSVLAAVIAYKLPDKQAQVLSAVAPLASPAPPPPTGRHVAP